MATKIWTATPPPEPQNIDDIRCALSQPRASLSPSKFSETAFMEFKGNNRRANTELTAMSTVVPTIAGHKDRQYHSAANIQFTRLEKFDQDLSTPTPDWYDGAKPAQISTRVRRDLGQYIVPTSRTNLPAAPNFFLEGKSTSGRPDIAQRQATYDGAVDARGMVHLQNYGKSTPVHDGNAYTLASTYHPGTGTLQMYATHPRPSVEGSGDRRAPASQV